MLRDEELARLRAEEEEELFLALEFLVDDNEEEEHAEGCNSIADLLVKLPAEKSQLLVESSPEYVRRVRSDSSLRKPSISNVKSA